MPRRKKSNFGSNVANNAKRQKKKAASFGYLTLPKSVKMFNVEENTRKVFLDFIPYEVTDANHPDAQDGAVVGELWYRRPFKIHRNIGSDNKSFVCLTSIGKKCPICEYYHQRLKKGDDYDDVKELKAKERNLYIVIPRDSKKHDEVSFVWDMAQSLFQDELNDRLEEDEDYGIFPDIEDGLTLEVKLKWKSIGKNTFPETRDIEFHKRDEAIDEDDLENTPNLDELLTVLSYKELEDKFFELEDDDTDDSPFKEVDEDEDKDKKDSKPRRTTGKKKDKKKDKPAKNKCPHGHKFGEDTEEHDECDDCDMWDACIEAKEKLEA